MKREGAQKKMKAGGEGGSSSKEAAQEQGQRKAAEQDKEETMGETLKTLCCSKVSKRRLRRSRCEEGGEGRRPC